jgi:hypothetical protein
VGRREQDDTEAHERETNQPPHLLTSRRDPLDKDDRRDGDHPDQMHHPKQEQDQHQRPATAQAVEPMDQPHAQRVQAS